MTRLNLRLWPSRRFRCWCGRGLGSWSCRLRRRLSRLCVRLSRIRFCWRRSRLCSRCCTFRGRLRRSSWSRVWLSWARFRYCRWSGLRRCCCRLRCGLNDLSRLCDWLNLLLVRCNWPRHRSRPCWNHRSNRLALRNWLGLRHHRWFPVIYSRELLTILRGLLADLNLGGHRRNALFPCCCEFCWQRAPRHATGTGVACSRIRVVDRYVVNDRIRDRAVVHVHVRGGHIVNRTVVVEAVALPISTLISGAGVAVSIIHSAVIANMRSPITVVIAITAP